jgi:hypothetical protein
LPTIRQLQVCLIARRECESCINHTGTCIQRGERKAYESCGRTRREQFLAD